MGKPSCSTRGLTFDPPRPMSNAVTSVAWLKAVGETQAAIDKLFCLRLDALRGGHGTIEAEDRLLPVDDVAAALVSEIAMLLRADASAQLAKPGTRFQGGLSPTMSRLLADYLDSMDSAQRWALLGMGEAARKRSAQGQRRNAVLAYAEAVAAGIAADECERRAYDAYFACAPQRSRATFADDSRRDSKRPDRYRTLAEQRWATIVRPFLVREGLMDAPRKGRKIKIPKEA